MYKFEDIRDVHLEITSKCQAKCPMCPRRINGGPMNPFIKLDDITLDRFKEWFPRQFIQQLNSMFMCGNLGDPIISRDTMEIFEHLREVNPRMKLSMHTNGSARETGWWKELAKHRVIVTFGIDGLEDTHHLYRISTDFNKIIDNAKAFIGAGGYAKWHMLVFEHNEHQVQEAKQMSEELGFKMFTTKNTTRFKDDHFQVIDEKGMAFNPPPSSIYSFGNNQDNWVAGSARVIIKYSDFTTIIWKLDGNQYSRFIIDAYSSDKDAVSHNFISQDGNYSDILSTETIVVIQGALYKDKATTLPSILTVGIGDLLIFNDGKYVQGTWRRTDISESFEFFDINQNPIEVPPSSQWIHVVPNEGQIVWSNS